MPSWKKEKQILKARKEFPTKTTKGHKGLFYYSSYIKYSLALSGKPIIKN